MSRGNDYTGKPNNQFQKKDNKKQNDRSYYEPSREDGDRSSGGGGGGGRSNPNPGRPNGNSSSHGHKGESVISCAKCTDIHLLSNFTTNVKNTITCTYLQEARGLNVPLEALIDTGALAANYMDQTTFDKLKSLDINCRNIDVQVCAAFANCQKASKAVDIFLSFNMNVNNKMKKFSIELSFTVLSNLGYELIIGRPDILKHDLWNKTLVYFQIPTVPKSNSRREDDRLRKNTSTSTSTSSLQKSIVKASATTTASVVADDTVESKTKTTVSTCPSSTSCLCTDRSRCQACIVQITYLGRASKEPLDSEPTKDREARRGEHGAGLTLADDSLTPEESSPMMELWEIASTEQLHAFSV